LSVEEDKEEFPHSLLNPLRLNPPLPKGGEDREGRIEERELPGD